MNKLNFKMINFVLICLAIYLLYNTLDLWLGGLVKLFSILLPFLVAFAIAYALYPFVAKLENRNVPKPLALCIVMGLVVGFIILVVALMIPVMIEQFTSLFNWILEFVNNIPKDYNVDINQIQEYIGDFKSILNNIGKSIGDFSLSLISQSVNLFTTAMIVIISSIYFLIDMDHIRTRIKKFLKRRNKKTFRYIKRLDYEVSQYFVGLEKYIIIQLIEYTTIFAIIGHPYYLLLGILCSVTTIIPYFGGIFANIIAALTAFFISKKLFILTLIVAFICPNIDSYIISPKVYGKTNNVPALLTILAVYAGGALFGIIGIIVSLPVTIILLATYRFYEDDISNKLDEMKSKLN